MLGSLWKGEGLRRKANFGYEDGLRIFVNNLGFVVGFDSVDYLWVDFE